ncbi:hypothetical protein, partial [Holospora obtusa]
SVGYSEYSKALAELFRNSPKTEVFWDRMDGFLRKKSALTIFGEFQNQTERFSKENLEKFEQDPLGRKILKDCVISSDTAKHYEEMIKSGSAFDNDPNFLNASLQFVEYINSNGYPTLEELLEIQSKEPEIFSVPNMIIRFYKGTYDENDIIDAYLDKKNNLKKVLEEASEILSEYKNDIKKTSEISDFVLRAKKYYENGFPSGIHELSKIFPIERQKDNLKILRLSMLEPVDVLNSKDQTLQEIIKNVSKKMDEFRKIKEKEDEEFEKSHQKYIEEGKKFESNNARTITDWIQGENFLALSDLFSLPSKKIIQNVLKDYIVSIIEGSFMSGEENKKYQKEIQENLYDFRILLRDLKSEQTVIEKYKTLKQKIETMLEKEQDPNAKQYLEKIKIQLFPGKDFSSIYKEIYPFLEMVSAQKKRRIDGFSQHLSLETNKEIENIQKEIFDFIDKIVLPKKERLSMYRAFSNIDKVSIINLNKEFLDLWSKLTANLDGNKKEFAKWMRETFYGKLEEIQSRQASSNLETQGLTEPDLEKKVKL